MLFSRERNNKAHIYDTGQRYHYIYLKIYILLLTIFYLLILSINVVIRSKKELINQYDLRDWFYLDRIIFNLDWVDPWVAIHPVVGGQQALTTGFSTHNLQKQSD